LTNKQFPNIIIKIDSAITFNLFFYNKMTKTLKTSIVALAVLAFGFVLMNTSHAAESTDVNLEVTAGTLTITASGAIDL
jgi:ABC-type spermidine/putrescine transport system permease subunit II